MHEVIDLHREVINGLAETFAREDINSISHGWTFLGDDVEENPSAVGAVEFTVRNGIDYNIRRVLLEDENVADVAKEILWKIETALLSHDIQGLKQHTKYAQSLEECERDLEDKSPGIRDSIKAIIRSIRILAKHG